MIFFHFTSRSNSSPTKNPPKPSPPNLNECFLISPTGNLKDGSQVASHTSLCLCLRMCVGCCA
jgi:hypothetical protein